MDVFVPRRIVRIVVPIAKCVLRARRVIRVSKNIARLQVSGVWRVIDSRAVHLDGSGRTHSSQHGPASAILSSVRSCSDMWVVAQRSQSGKSLVVDCAGKRSIDMRLQACTCSFVLTPRAAVSSTSGIGSSGVRAGASYDPTKLALD